MNPKLLFSWMLALVLTACSGSSQMTPTPTAIDGAINAGVELIRQDMYLRLTQQSLENERIETGARMTATQQVQDATATQARHEENQKATARAESATQQAYQVTVAAGQAQDTATAQAQATATQQAYLQMTSTAAAQATGTQQAVIASTAAFEAKSTEAADKKTQEAPVMWARQTAVYAESQKTQIELQKAQATMWISAWGGWAFGFIALAVGIFVVWKRSQIGVIADENGKVRIVMINQRALQPGLMHDPVIDFSGGKVTVPALGTPPEMQHQLVHERNIVDAIAELPQGYPRQALGMTAQMSTPQSVINLQVVQPGQVQSWLEDVQGQMSSQVEENE